MMAVRWSRFDLECGILKNTARIPSIFADTDIESLPTWLPVGYRELAALMMQMMDRPQLLAVGGARGTGKTVLASGLVRKFCDCGRAAIYRTISEFFDELSNSEWEKKEDVRRAYHAPDLVVLDEVQVRDTDRVWQDNELTSLVDWRHREGKSTLLMSNLTAEQLAINLGDSIWRRLIETGGDPIETDWPRIEEVIQRMAEARKNKTRP